MEMQVRGPVPLGMPAQPVSWVDVSPHSSGAVQVGNIRLGCLDWGRHGPPLLLLPGLGDTPHIFDALAPRLSRRHRVLRLNRRGHGDSDAPNTGYDPQTLASNLAGFLRALELEGVTLVGHSIAGNEMTALAAAGEPRLTGLIYLDAAYDRSGTSGRMRLDPLLTRHISASPVDPPRDLDGYRERAQDHFGFWNDALEANLRARLRLNQSGNPNLPLRSWLAASWRPQKGTPPATIRCQCRAWPFTPPSGTTTGRPTTVETRSSAQRYEPS